MDSKNDNIIEIKTVQASTIKILVEALKEILSDTVIIINDQGIKICTMESSRVILVHLKLSF